MKNSESTALDKLMGTSPHFAAATDFGLFCPACSDPFKLSFVPAKSCQLAVWTASRTEVYAEIHALMIQAGLKTLPSPERSKQLSEHQMAFKRAQLKWREEVRKEHGTDSL